MGRENHGYDIYKKYKIEEILKSLNEDKLPDRVIYNEIDYKDSLRRAHIMKNLMIRNGIKCVKCNIIPSYFALGKDKIGKWHLDLYGGDTNDFDHMLTIDHIHPKSKGGGNTMENYQLMCKICNEDKSDSVNGEESSQRINTKRLYIDKKLTSLSEQLRGVMNKIKSKEIICVNKVEGFTIGKQYQVIDIKIKIGKKYEVTYELVTTNDEEKKVHTVFDNFITKMDYLHYKKT